jgi:hypothetical protein
MPDIMVLLACVSQYIEPTPFRQLGRVIEAMLSMSGRVTMRGLSRWCGKGGSYRTIQRFFGSFHETAKVVNSACFTRRYHEMKA